VPESLRLGYDKVVNMTFGKLHF